MEKKKGEKRAREGVMAQAKVPNGHSTRMNLIRPQKK